MPKVREIFISVATPAYALAERPVQDYAKSSIYVARHQMVTPGGDLALARDYLERVANSNAEEVTQAADWLKKLKSVLLLRPPPGAPH